ncbi:MAG: hypothetical protein ACYC2I_14510, partial [Elusimicrobiales bacterium]
IITWFADGNYHNCPGECGSQAQPLIFTSNGVWLDFSDLGSGLSWMGVYRITETGSVFHSSQAYTAGGEVQYNVPTAIKQLEDGKYQLVVLDKSGKYKGINNYIIGDRV